MDILCNNLDKAYAFCYNVCMNKNHEQHTPVEVQAKKFTETIFGKFVVTAASMGVATGTLVGIAKHAEPESIFTLTNSTKEIIVQHGDTLIGKNSIVKNLDFQHDGIVGNMDLRAGAKDIKTENPDAFTKLGVLKSGEIIVVPDFSAEEAKHSQTIEHDNG